MENQEFQKTLSYIFDLIENGMLQLGDKLPTERAISAKLGVSRNFVREAIRSLEALGLVECRQGSGNYLADNIGDSIAKAVNLLLLIHKINRDEVFSFRRAMDKAVCRYIIENGISPDARSSILSALEHMKTAANKSEETDADKEFHYALIYATGSRLWITLLDAVTEVYHKWIDAVVAASDGDFSDYLISVHEKIVDGLLARNTSACLNAVDEHYDIIGEMHI